MEQELFCRVLCAGVTCNATTRDLTKATGPGDDDDVFVLFCASEPPHTLLAVHVMISPLSISARGVIEI